MRVRLVKFNHIITYNRKPIWKRVEVELSFGEHTFRYIYDPSTPTHNLFECDFFLNDNITCKLFYIGKYGNWRYDRASVIRKYKEDRETLEINISLMKEPDNWMAIITN